MSALSGMFPTLSKKSFHSYGAVAVPAVKFPVEEAERPEAVTCKLTCLFETLCHAEELEGNDRWEAKLGIIFRVTAQKSTTVGQT